MGSGFIDLLEPGDLVLANKGFPKIKSEITASGKKVTFTMPPFLENQEFTAEEVKETIRIAGVRIHLERVIQRLSTA